MAAPLGLKTANSDLSNFMKLQDCRIHQSQQISYFDHFPKNLDMNLEWMNSLSTYLLLKSESKYILKSGDTAVLLYIFVIYVSLFINTLIPHVSQNINVFNPFHLAWIFVFNVSASGVCWKAASCVGVGTHQSKCWINLNVERAWWPLWWTLLLPLSHYLRTTDLSLKSSAIWMWKGHGMHFPHC